jgi:hypothetical protein
MPDALLRPVPSEPVPFSTPRTWALLSRALGLAENAGGAPKFGRKPFSELLSIADVGNSGRRQTLKRHTLFTQQSTPPPSNDGGIRRLALSKRGRNFGLRLLLLPQRGPSPV